ncbi:MAG: recombination protein RecR [Candidatus Marinimicrobia bacterium]|nr:recombination protein RecR [Candidatus Neomarinimicrobiota bacterium]MBT3675853.1 recombination protein RecR [Candidatus Neomarinimicrobiota bacterium]MBT3763498.1 recombination protein RecR [Candidatus Neomarinimicrobiota bacterium]MBT4068586.1 recombination protein RecR [Candidatus Neomarinimicrobiota bacterium]MBT4271548.1 recombination protein RecR [Candidatus Neomarinimicrobiota bacterium]
MGSIPESINRLIEEFSRFPGIGRKTAQRMAFYVLKSPNEQAVQLAQSVMDMKTKIKFCSICFGITEEDPCQICDNPKRDQSSICIVEDAADVYTFEKTNVFQGVYHVLGGVLSPLDGIGPDDLKINQLIDRTQPGDEVIIATNPSIEGEATSLYIGKLLNGKDVKVTRLARGLPMGGNLEYIDEATIMRAMEGRTSL